MTIAPPAPTTETRSRVTVLRRSGLTALVMVDVQHDFLPGGALAVPHGDEVIEPLLAAAHGVDVVVATQDWHPLNHCSFAAHGGSWPVHCVRWTSGSEIHPLLATRAQKVYRKATCPQEEAYSGFYGTALARDLRTAGVTRLLVGGLATDYCVKATVMDALSYGFDVTVLAKACRAVTDGDAALAEMEQAGARVER